ncbi:MAG: tRNA uridine-5-carboxymethylaminomethyl(34) synthesis enzyme MnmG [Bacteroidetes bacterium]|nr:tRNA uridine-5-carboxymethylaminomethyl(34) synthesis enzyme MnmG [Bacteroidota bacterium]MCW5894602.1 tRNA uridine-5-carboxymethylaminomethyl(34) synthesis enzyme MnmG [Bacteroidota bacterium]
MHTKYDVVVVGGGHAGIEASLASARMGCNTALITMDLSSIGRMSCNPAIGGSAKGHLVREVDALGGEMGKIADATGIHFRMLNKSKGPAIWSPRCQSDREWYSREAARRILCQENLTTLRDTIVDIRVENRRLTAIVTGRGLRIACRAVVFCTGTFLNAIMHTGRHTSVGGRYEEPASSGLSDKLASLGLKMGRLKTGTPPRVDRRSIDYSETEQQEGDTNPVPFSFQTKEIRNAQIPMFLTHTNRETHSILQEGFDDSPMFTGRIKGVGPRYCPSIEDKLHRFSDRERHQIFLEPEGYESQIVYVNGFSTSLPEKIQSKAIRTIPGLRNVRVLRPGYAVEYDYFPPHQLEHTLKSKFVEGLYFAGQVNGTSGYEEAAAQGLIAGINSALAVKEQSPFILKRNEAYIGVLIDDLINKGTDEPYRIFTSRAEYRLLLRQDNADSRLMYIGHQLGLVSNDSIKRLSEKEGRIQRAKEFLGFQSIRPSVANPMLDRTGSQSIIENETLGKLLKRPEISISDLLSVESIRQNEAMFALLVDRDARDRVEIEVKYEGYLKRQEEQIENFKKSESIVIPHDFVFDSVKSISKEGRERLANIKPRSLGQASRISGVTSADISVLMIHLRS